MKFAQTFHLIMCRNVPLTALYGLFVTLSAEYFRVSDFLCHFALTKEICYEKVQIILVCGSAPAAVFL